MAIEAKEHAFATWHGLIGRINDHALRVGRPKFRLNTETHRLFVTLGDPADSVVHPFIALEPHVVATDRKRWLIEQFDLSACPREGFAVLGHLPAFADKLAALDDQPKAFICVGGKEQDPPTRTSPVVAMTLEEMQAMVAHARMVDAAAEFVPALREAGLRDVTHITFEGEDHMSVLPPAIMRGLSLAVPQPN